MESNAGDAQTPASVASGGAACEIDPQCRACSHSRRMARAKNAGRVIHMELTKPPSRLNVIQVDQDLNRCGDSLQCSVIADPEDLCMHSNQLSSYGSYGIKVSQFRSAGGEFFQKHYDVVSGLEIRGKTHQLHEEHPRLCVIADCLKHTHKPQS